MNTPADDGRSQGAGAVARVVRELTADEITAYRDVVRNGNAAPFVERDEQTASPVHPFVLAQNAFDAALTSVTSAGGEAGPRVVHLSQEVHQQRPMRAGERVTFELEVVGARRDPRGVRLVLRSVLVGEDGVPFAELVSGLLLLGATSPAPFGKVPPHPARASTTWQTVVTRHVPAELPRRYAEVSGDNNPIHLDPDAARAAGFPGVIAHGMSVMALVCEEVIAQYACGDAARVQSVGGRFSSPVLPGEPLDICLQPAADGMVLFCCKTPRGLAVKNGWVRIATEGQDQRSGPATPGGR